MNTKQKIVSCSSFLGVIVFLYLLFYVYDPRKIPVQSQYDCIFGFSTGHVGTTTLSDITSYNKGQISGLGLIFEGSNPLRAKKIFVTQKQYNKNFTIKNEIKFVQKKFAPLLVNMQRLYNARIMMDLGHYNLFYYNGIVQYFTSPKYASIRPDNICKHLLFVRIRRPRFETAFSLFYQSTGRSITNICTDFTVNYCPTTNPHAVILHPPSLEAWNSLTPFQQTLWIIDETNARWHRFKQMYPHVDVIELFWSSHQPGSLIRAINNISDILGIPRQPLTTQVSVNRVHAGANNRNNSLDEQEKSDREYRNIMKLHDNPHFKIHHERY